MFFDQGTLHNKLLMPCKKAWLNMVKLPTTETQLPEECDNRDNQLFTDLMVEREVVAPFVLALRTRGHPEP